MGYTKSSRRGAVESSAVQQQNRTVAPTKLYFSKPWKYLTEEVFDLENGDHYPSRFARIRKWKTLLTISLVLTALVSTVSASAARQRPTSSRRMAGTQNELSFTDKIKSAANKTGSWIKDNAKVATQWATKKIEQQLESYDCDNCERDEKTGVYLEKDGEFKDQRCRICDGDGSVSVTDRFGNAINTLSAKAKVAGRIINDKWTKFNKCECNGKDTNCKLCNGDGDRSVTDRFGNAVETLSAKAKKAGTIINDKWTKFNKCECNGKDTNCKLCNGDGDRSVTDRFGNAVETLSAKAKEAKNYLKHTAAGLTEKLKKQLASYDCDKCGTPDCQCGGTGRVKRLSHRVRHKANKIYEQAGKTLSEAYGGVTGHLGKAYDGAKQWTEKQYTAAKAQAKKAKNYLSDKVSVLNDKTSRKCTKGENCKDKNCQCKGDGRVSLTDRAHHKAKVAGNWISDKVSGVKETLSNGYTSLKKKFGSWWGGRRRLARAYAEEVIARRRRADHARMEARDADAMSPSELAMHRRRLAYGARVSPVLAALMDEIEAAKCDHEQ